VGRKKKYDVVKPIRIGLSHLEKTWLESHDSQSELLNQLVRKAMSETTVLNPKIQEIVCRAITRLSTEGVEINAVLKSIDTPELDVVAINQHKTKIIPLYGYKFIYLGKVECLDGRVAFHWHLVDCPNPFALVVIKSSLDEDDEILLRDAKSIPEYMLAKLAEQKSND
jgi:hypothetical protein